MAGQLTTLDAVKAQLTITDSSSDSKLNQLIARASAALVSYIGRRLEQAAITQTVLLHGTRHEHSVALALYPVTEVSAVMLDGAALDSSAYSLDAEDAEAGILRVYALAGCHRHPLRVSVTYTGGYVLPGDQGANLPADIEGACIDMVRALWLGGDRDPLVRTEVVQGVGSTSYLDPQAGAGGLPAATAASLQPYRRMGV